MWTSHQLLQIKYSAHFLSLNFIRSLVTQDKMIREFIDCGFTFSILSEVVSQSEIFIRNVHLFLDQHFQISRNLTFFKVSNFIVYNILIKTNGFYACNIHLNGL